MEDFTEEQGSMEDGVSPKAKNPPMAGFFK